MSKLKIKKDDLVKVIAGKDKGKTGKVLRVIPEKNSVIVEGIKIISKHEKPSAKNPQGGIVKKEAPINISNVAYVIEGEGSDAKTSKIGRKSVDGKLKRFAKNNDKILD